MELVTYYCGCHGNLVTKAMRYMADNNNNSLITTNNQNTMVMCLSTTQVQSYE